MHIPNDNWQERYSWCSGNGNNGNGHNGHNGNGFNVHDSVFVNRHLVPEFEIAIKYTTGLSYDYNLELAAAAVKHAEAMMMAGRVYNTEPHNMVGDAENVGAIEVIASDFGKASWALAGKFKDDYVHGNNLIKFREMGIGFAIKPAPPIYIVFTAVRLAKRRVA